MIHNHSRFRALTISRLLRRASRPQCLAAMLACTVLVSSIATPVSAKWLLEADKSAPGQDTKAASVVAQNREAVLRLDCENGLQQLSIAANHSFERGMIASVITLDGQKPKTGLLKVYSGRNDIPIFDIPLTELIGVKRLAIELQPVTGASARYVFDTSGAKPVVKAVQCVTKPAPLLRQLESKIPPLRARLKKALPSRAQSLDDKSGESTSPGEKP